MYVARDLRGLAEEQPELTSDSDDVADAAAAADATVRPGGFRCGGWRARAGGAELVLEGDGDAVDGLRALCAAAWTAAGDGTCGLDAGKALAQLGL